MNAKEILDRQWEGYDKYHRSRINLWTHVFAVPVFIFGTLSLLVSIINVNALLSLISIGIMAAAMGIQGFGHKKEALPAAPFTSAKNAVIRIFLEQLYTFPKFLLSGKWYSALRVDRHTDS
jgi:hypothetical protein